MSNDFEFYHGIILCKIIHQKESKNIKLFNPKSNSSYIIDEKIGIFVKYSTKRLSPWTFTFTKDHKEEIKELKNKLDKVFIIFICNKDGIACLSIKELDDILNESTESNEWVRIRRQKREKYEVRGSKNKLKGKIGDADFPNKIFN